MSSICQIFGYWAIEGEYNKYALIVSYCFFFFSVISSSSIQFFGTPFAMSKSATGFSCFPWTITSSPAFFPGSGVTDTKRQVQGWCKEGSCSPAVEEAHACCKALARSSATRENGSNWVMSVHALRPCRNFTTTEIGFSSPFLYFIIQQNESR